MKLSPELEEICTCNNLDHTELNYYCPANIKWSFMVGKWAGFNPYEDTCLGCGGQKTPEWPGYGPDGPENGNCAQELPECDLNLEMSSDFVEYANDDQFLIVLDVYTSCPNECGEKHIPILYESIEGHDPMYILGCGKCGVLDDDWNPKYVYEKKDGQIIKHYRESSTFDVVPMHPSLKNSDGTFKAEEYICPDCATDLDESGLDLWEKFTCPTCEALISESYMSRGHDPSGYMAEEALDYEDVENQAVLFDIINMIESNDLWNELVFELIARGDAVRRPDGKIIFTDRAPQYDIIEDIAEYTSPKFEFNADGDIK